MTNAVSNITLITIIGGAAAVIIIIYIKSKYLTSESQKDTPDDPKTD